MESLKGFFDFANTVIWKLLGKIFESISKKVISSFLI